MKDTIIQLATDWIKNNVGEKEAKEFFNYIIKHYQTTSEEDDSFFV